MRLPNNIPEKYRESFMIGYKACNERTRLKICLSLALEEMGYSKEQIDFAIKETCEGRLDPLTDLIQRKTPCES